MQNECKNWEPESQDVCTFVALKVIQHVIVLGLF